MTCVKTEPTAMITFVEIKEQSFRQGLAEGEARSRVQERARALADLVGTAWGEETQRAFETRLASLPAGAWPTIPDLYAARQAARDPLELLEAAANDRAPEGL